MPRVKILRNQEIKHNGKSFVKGDEFECTDKELRGFMSVKTPLVTVLKSPVEMSKPSDEDLNIDDVVADVVKPKKAPTKKKK